MENKEKVILTENNNEIYSIEDIAEALKILYERGSLFWKGDFSGGEIKSAIREARKNARKAEEFSDKH